MYHSSMSIAEPAVLCDPTQIGFAADAAIAPGRSLHDGAEDGAQRHRDSLNAKVVRSIIKARAVRREFFGAQLFADPAWDMLLELYALTCEGRRVSISKLSLAAGVPGTTALRWMEKLEAECLVVRTDDPLDARRVWITLSKSGHSAMEAFVNALAGRDPGA